MDIFIYSLFAAFAPIFLWLLFWLRNDFKEREPSRLLFKTFIFGLSSAFFILWIEKIILPFMEINSYNQIFLFSFLEEFGKFTAVFLAALGTVWNNEREDPLIYMIVGALGFAAIENFFYINSFLNNGYYLESMSDGTYRFIGATLLHVVASAFVGIFISAVFYKSKKIRIIMAFFGLFFATFIHAFFNILVSSQDYKILSFASVWILSIFVLWVFYRISHDNNMRIIHNKNIYIYENKKFDEYKNDSFRKKFY